MRIGPVSFLFVVVVAWAAIRATMLWPSGAPDAPRPIAWAPAVATGMPAAAIVARDVKVVPASARSAGPRLRDPEEPIAILAFTVEPVPDAAPARSSPRSPAPAVTPIHPPQPPLNPAPSRSRLGVSAWAIVRGEATPGLAAAGQLGGSQAGVRAHLDLGHGLAAAARLSGPLRSSRGKEAAIALDWRPVGAIPLTFTVERRAGLDRGGRDAFAAGLFGGVDALPLPLGARLDGYGQAGLVGLQQRDPYVDASVRVERDVTRLGSAKLSVGAGVWGGAQRGVSRLDAGPQVVLRVPVGSGGIRIGAEWRARVAGNANPGSGPALSIGAGL